ncbi:MAG: hypothetical protein DWQ07_25980 [Chloroflexi bacterium]|nr:MAG: hypothetical protein DWQ07_25980 [Chloroflexota bacterium]
MSGIETFFRFFQIVFPTFLALGLGIPLLSPIFTKKMIPIVAWFLGISITNLWVAALIAVIDLLLNGISIYEILLSIVILFSALIFTLLMQRYIIHWLIEFAIYKRAAA